MRKGLSLFLLFFICRCSLGQGLENICPLILQQMWPVKDISFILTLTDYNTLRNTAARFDNSIQIVDAGQPWPPRWFAAMPVDTFLGPPYSMVIPLNASMQNGAFSYFSEVLINDKINGQQNRQGFIICNKNLQVTDTFIMPADNLDHHELVIEKDKGKLFFVLHDTVVDMSKVYNNVFESALHISYEIIEIADATGNIIFRWDPFINLGDDAEYPKYRKSKTSWSRPGMTDWGHGNSLSFDFDGNILYSYRNIGIGKISRKDGHIIWRIDRKNIRPNAFSDTIPCYMEHDLRAEKDAKGKIYYSFFSNGDGSQKTCAVVEFTAKDTLNGQYVFKIRKKFTPLSKPVYSAGQGNYEIEADGNYLINYGGIKGDTAQNICFEYRNKDDSILARYLTAYRNAPAYRVHALKGWRPERPVIKKGRGGLHIGKSYAVAWYKLDYTKLMAVRVSTGKTFKPQNAGLYCAVVPYGIGYVVSKPVAYTR